MGTDTLFLNVFVNIASQSGGLLIWCEKNNCLYFAGIVAKKTTSSRNIIAARENVQDKVASRLVPSVFVCLGIFSKLVFAIVCFYGSLLVSIIPKCFPLVSIFFYDKQPRGRL